MHMYIFFFFYVTTHSGNVPYPAERGDREKERKKYDDDGRNLVIECMPNR